MTIKSTENKMAKLKEKFQIKACEIVDSEVLKSLTKIKKKYKYDSIKMISGMGVSVFSVVKNGENKDVVDTTKPEFAHFNDIHEFLKFMAGVYNTYPSDVLI